MYLGDTSGTMTEYAPTIFPASAPDVQSVLILYRFRSINHNP